jgi:MFS family permease
VTAQPARLGALWFGIQVVWSALLGVFVQSRVVELAPGDDIRIYGAVAAGGAIVAAIVQVAIGFASDRRVAAVGHRREFYAAGVATAIVGIVELFLAGSVAELVLAFVVIQIGMNVVGGPYQAAVPDAIGAEASGRASAWMSVYQFCGSVTGLLIAAATRGLVAGLLLAAALAAGYAVTILHLRRLGPVSARSAPLRLTRDVRTVLLSRGAINVGFYTLFGFLFFFVRETLHVADARTTTGILFIAFTLAGVAGAALAGWPADRYDKRLVVTVAAVAIALAVGAFAAAPDVRVAVAAAVASGAAWGAFFTADWAIAYAVLPRGAMAAAMGVWNLAAAIPQVLAPLLTAPLVAAVDARSPGLGPRIALLLVIGEFAVGAIWLWRLPPQRVSDAARSG